MKTQLNGNTPLGSPQAAQASLHHALDYSTHNAERAWMNATRAWEVVAMGGLAMLVFGLNHTDPVMMVSGAAVGTAAALWTARCAHFLHLAQRK